MARNTNLLAMALEAPKREREPEPYTRRTKHDDLVRALMAKQAFSGGPVYSIGEGMAKVGQMALMGFYESRDKKQQREGWKADADALGLAVGGDAPKSGTPENQRLAKALTGADIDTSFADNVIGVESSGNLHARPRDPKTGELLSSAYGPGQFIDSTWTAFIRDEHPELLASGQDVLALRSDPNLSRQAVDWYGDQNAEFLQNAGLPVNDGTKYLAHFAGPGGAQKVLTADPNASAEAVLGRQVVQANPFLAGMTAGDVQRWAGEKMGGGAGSNELPGGIRIGNEPDTLQDNRGDFAGDFGRLVGQESEHFRSPAAQTPVQPPVPYARPEMPQQPSPAPAAAQALQMPQQPPQNMRQALGPHVGDPGSYINMMRQHQQTGALPGMNGLVNQLQPQGGQMGRSIPPQDMNRNAAAAMAGPPPPQAGAIAPAGQRQPYQAPGQQAQSGVPPEIQQEANALLEGVPQQEQIALRRMIQSGQASPWEVVQYLQKRQAAQQPDFQYIETPEGIVQIDKRSGQTQLVHQADPAASGRTIPGTSIDIDSSMGEKYAAYVNQGFSHEQALGVASGRYDLRVTDTGHPVMVDRLSNQEVPIRRLGPSEIEQRERLGPTPGPQPQGQPQQAGQTDALGLDPQQHRTLYEMADSGTGLWNILGDFAGRVGPQFVPGDNTFFPDQREAVTTIKTANRGLIRALQQSPRYAEGERKSIEQEIALNPSIGMSPEAWRHSAVSVDRLLRTWWREDMEDARSNTLAAEDRQRALASARAIERYLQILGVPQGNGQGAPQGQGDPIPVTSPAEARALPPGTLYRTPDGQTFRTPAGDVSNEPQSGAGQHPPFDENGNPVVAETGEAVPHDRALQQARDAIAEAAAKGVDIRPQVIERLKQMNIDPAGL